MKKILMLALLFVGAANADVSLTPTYDDWDGGNGYAIEGQVCTSPNGYYRQCAPGLVCETDAYRNGGQGICRRTCQNNYDCGYNQTCVYHMYSYVGTCSDYNDGWDRPTPPSSGYCRSDYDCGRNRICQNGRCTRQRW